MLKPITYTWGLFLTCAFFAHTILSSALLIILLFFISSKEFVDWYISKFWAQTILSFCNVKIKAHGLENIPKDSGGLYVFNHGSNMDIMAIAAALPAVRFGAKGELFRIPFLSRAMKMAGMLPIYRKNRRKVFEVYKQARSNMNEGTFYALAPEGTRVREKTLAPFKSGPFYFAIGAQAPVIPVVIVGAKDVMKKNGFAVHPNSFSGHIDLHVLPVIETTSLIEKDVHKLKAQAREVMLEVYCKHENLS